ncbi:MAG: phage minor head protein, partial [Fastidiosipilaceae bacterium]
ILSGSTRGEIHRIVERHRRELLRLERGAASEMVRAYGGIWQRLQQELDRLLEDYNAALKVNDEISPSWVYEHDRLYNLQRQVEAELRRFADYAEAQIIANEREAVTAAGRHFQEILTTTARGRPGIVGAWDRLPIPAIEDLVGFTANGSPLRTLLDELGPAASEAVRSGLIQGLALGQNPRAIARQIRQGFGGVLVRALRISRTETLRSYREATRRNYQANSDIIAGWRWLAAKQGRTCAACLAMDGSFHTLDDYLDDHPNGRCAMVPVLKGEEGAPPVWETGSEWLDKQPEAVQRHVLGNAGYEAYKAGAVTLSDFVGQKSDPRWGTTRYARSLTEILGADEAKRWRTSPSHPDVGKDED